LHELLVGTLFVCNLAIVPPIVEVGQVALQVLFAYMVERADQTHPLQPALLWRIGRCAFQLSRGMSAMAQREMAQHEESREPVKKTPADHLADTLAQLKEIRHYSKNNVEHLTATWMLFDGELSKLKRTDKIEDLMNRQGQLYDALEAVIADLEGALKDLQPVTAE
jgi:hypothetical protein